MEIKNYIMGYLPGRQENVTLFRALALPGSIPVEGQVAMPKRGLFASWGTFTAGCTSIAFPFAVLSHSIRNPSGARLVASITVFIPWCPIQVSFSLFV